MIYTWEDLGSFASYHITSSMIADVPSGEV